MEPVLDITLLEKKAAEHQKIHKEVLRKTPKNKALKMLPMLHEEAFSRIDCLQCANCCKNYSPRFKLPDIKRASKRLRMKESEFISAYLRLDEEGDYVVNRHPCPFLGEDNYCGIYEDRPRDCARYPYTDEDVFIKQPALSLKNISACPAAFYVVERMLEMK
jgi:Fe-S-cluster containining protein